MADLEEHIDYNFVFSFHEIELALFAICNWEILKVVFATFLQVCFVYPKEKFFETRKNAFRFAITYLMLVASFKNVICQ